MSDKIMVKVKCPLPCYAIGKDKLGRNCECVRFRNSPADLISRCNGIIEAELVDWQFIESLVPPQIEQCYTKGEEKRPFEIIAHQGYNRCRQQMLDNISQMKGE